MKLKTFLLAVLFMLIASDSFAVNYDFVDGKMYCKINSDNESVTITYGGEKIPQSSNVYYEGDIIIPDSVVYKGKTYTVTCIGSKAFAYSNTNHVTIGKSVKEIQDHAFSHSKITRVSMENSIEKIGDHAFEECANIVSIKLSDSIEEITSGMFRNCTSLSSVILPSSLKILHNAFYGCTALTTIKLPQNLEQILGSFENCTGLLEIIIPNNVQTVGFYSFINCINLTSVTIGSSVSTIGQNAFNGSKNIETIKSYAKNPPKIEQGALFGEDKIFDDSTYDKATLYVPEGRAPYYLAKDGWREFQNVEEGIPTIKPEYKVDINEDGVVDVSDMTILVDAILGK